MVRNVSLEKTATKPIRDKAIIFREKILALEREFADLKLMLFGNSSFIIYQNDNLQKRYDQLLGFFYPEFRVTGWINPLNEEVD